MLTNIPQLSGVGSNHSFTNLKKFSLPSELKKKKRKEKKVEKNAQVARIACILIEGTSIDPTPIDPTPNSQSRNFKKCTASSWENFHRDIESGKVKDLERGLIPQVTKYPIVSDPT